VYRYRLFTGLTCCTPTHTHGKTHVKPMGIPIPMKNTNGGIQLLLFVASECIHFGEEFSESFNPLFGAKEVSWYYVLFIIV
jgi:hypothetical protein